MPVEIVLIERVVPNDGAPLRAALNQLFLGVAPAESQAGLISAFYPFTSSGLRGVTIDGQIATIDLTEAFTTTNNFGTSNMIGVVFTQIEETVYAFDELNGIDFSVEGERWCGWENVCEGSPQPLLARD